MEFQFVLTIVPVKFAFGDGDHTINPSQVLRIIRKTRDDTRRDRRTTHSPPHPPPNATGAASQRATPSRNAGRDKTPMHRLDEKTEACRPSSARICAVRKRFQAGNKHGETSLTQANTLCADVMRIVLSSE